MLPIGYADGFRRKPNNWGEVLVHGRRAKIAGRVCMDQCMINVSHIEDVKQGDEVVLIGYQGDDRIRAEDVARQLDTNNYEVTSMVMARVPRVYIDKRAATDILRDYPGGRLFKTAEEVDEYIRKERESWKRDWDDE